MRLCTVILSFVIIIQLAAQTPCINGMAAGYPCDQVTFLSNLPIDSIAGGTSAIGNDIWGWTDENSGREFVIFGLSTGTSFIEITDPLNPIYLGFLPSASDPISWRDMKTYQHYAYIVSEHFNHGIQIFDLHKLLNVTNPPLQFEEDANFPFRENIGGRAHNIVGFPEDGKMVLVGARDGICNNGLEFYDVSDPLLPKFTGCFSADGYTHDAVCFSYQGPDSVHIGKEICIASNEDTQTIVDVSDNSSPIQLSKTSYYSGIQHYTHQGWITDDHRYLIFNDELDELRNNFTTRTHVMDISDLDAPVYKGFYDHGTEAIDHNCFVRGQYVYAANYESGLRIMNIKDLATTGLTLSGYFDTFPSRTARAFNGVWGTYPYFDSGVIAMSDRQRGLFLLRPEFGQFIIESNGTHTQVCEGDPFVVPISILGLNGYTDEVTISISGLPNEVISILNDNTLNPGESTTLTTATTGLSGKYSILISGKNMDGSKIHDRSVSFEVIGAIDQSRKYKDITFDENTVLSASETIILEKVKVLGGANVTIFSPKLEIIDSVGLQNNAFLKWIEEDLCDQQY